MNVLTNLSMGGAWITFQVTFTELFIAASVFSSVAYKRGWRSAVLGAFLGVLVVTLVAAVLRIGADEIPLRILDWISALLLLGFGFYVYYEFVDGLRNLSKADPDVSSGLKVGGFSMPLNWTGVSLSGWAVMAEGFEIMIVWLAVSLKLGTATASFGVLIGLAVIGLIAFVLGRSGVFALIPATVLDFLAATAITAYGLYFLWEAAR